jgi:hypothetical protein
MWNGVVSRKTVRRFLRYIIMFFAVFITSQYIPECPISYTTAFIMATTAAITFSIIDMYYPLLAEK